MERKTYTCPELLAKLQRCGITMSRTMLVYAMNGRKKRNIEPYLVKDIDYAQKHSRAPIIYYDSAVDKIINKKKALV